MKTDEMIEILEGIIRDEETNPTARVTAIRALRQIEQDRGADDLHDELERLIADKDKPRVDDGSGLGHEASGGACRRRSPLAAHRRELDQFLGERERVVGDRDGRTDANDENDRIFPAPPLPPPPQTVAARRAKRPPKR